MFAFVFAVFTAAPEPPGVAEVREVYAACTALKESAKPERWVEPWKGDQAQKWVREAQRGEADVFSALELFRDGGALRFAVLDESSPSGDWVQTTEYCFRPDGSLAFLFSTLRTFYGGVKAETRKYFDAAGKQLAMKRANYDLKTGKPTKAQFMDRQAEVFASAKKLLALLSR